MTSIAGVEIGNGAPCRIVAEISNAHNGSLDRALDLIEAAAKAGADFVKFQCYTPDELVLLRGDGPAPDPWGSEGWSMRDLYEKAQTPHAWFPTLVGKCEEVGVPWFSSVFGLRSLTLLEALECPAYKVAALDMNPARFNGLGGMDLLAAIRLTGKPSLVSLRKMDWVHVRADFRLYCPKGYPQEPHSINLAAVHRNGFSFHGTSVAIPMAAIDYGATLIECHVQLDDEPSELEEHVSLTVTDLAQLCAAVKGATRAG